MRKTILINIFLLASLLIANGQGKSELLRRINEIKSQNDIYYWNNYTGYDADTAKVNATKWLLLDVNANKPESEKVTVDELMRHASYISIDRGNAKQYFAYIRKTDADALKRGTAAYATAGRYDTFTTGQQPYTQPAPKSFVPDAFVQRVMHTETFLNVYKLLKALKAQGSVLQFGKLRDVDDYSSLDLILFDMKSQEIVTMLSAEQPGGSRVNLVSGYEDSLDNYPAELTAVIWYINK